MSSFMKGSSTAGGRPADPSGSFRPTAPATGRSHKRKSSSSSLSAPAAAPSASQPSTLATFLPPAASCPTLEAEDEGESIESAGEAEVEHHTTQRVRTCVPRLRLLPLLASAHAKHPIILSIKSSSSATSAGSYTSPTHSPHTSYFSATYAAFPSSAFAAAAPYPSPPYAAASTGGHHQPFASAPCSPTYTLLAELAAFGPKAQEMPEPMRNGNINLATSSARSTLEVDEPAEEELVHRVGLATTTAQQVVGLGLFGLGGMTVDVGGGQEETADDDVAMDSPSEGFRYLPPLPTNTPPPPFGAPPVRTGPVIHDSPGRL